jgi:hypothetical protein
MMQGFAFVNGLKELIVVSKSYAYRSAAGLVTLLSVLMVADGCLAIIGAWSGWQQVKLLNDAFLGIPIDDEQAETNDVRQALIGWAQIGFTVLLAVLFLVWINRVNKNAWALGARSMEFTPGWCVGWFFVPVANLYKPYQAVREIWRASNPGFSVDWQRAPSSSLLALWWAFWLISCVIGRIAFRLNLRAEGLESLRIASVVQVISDLVDIPPIVLALAMLRRIQTMQEEKKANLLESSDPIGLS